jgi:hypothetical protein
MTFTGYPKVANPLRHLQYHRGSKSLDADLWLDNFYTEDISLQYANLPVLSGVSVRQVRVVYPDALS